MGHGLYRTAALGAGVTSLSLVRTFCTRGAGSGRRERDTVGYRGGFAVPVCGSAHPKAGKVQGRVLYHSQ